MAIKITKTKMNLMDFFYQNPNKEIHLRALGRELGISHTWIKNLSSDLVKKGLLVSKTGLAITLKANMDSLQFKRQKLLFNIASIYRSGLLDFLIETYNHPKAIILFGSYRYGEDNEQSDIDIAVITSRHMASDISHYEKKLARKISIKELEGSISKEFRSTLSNGIVLYGYLE
ncbi:MAG: nucleotidyltransferase domain-containing protein [archaeon]